ncbi:hypothetical protein GO286_03002 [Ralstonia solanacearum]|nr:hypothetical protein [Ralstonia solanacearum]QKL50908.1 hypothetical protein HI816_03035 [Ralstonia solanacearum]QKM22163.1 hypothetical protein HI796_03030 [Ralstonia solanacearum]QKM26971.1 hypothetical protein HI795_03035 [Ralstonia solanacearum]
MKLLWSLLALTASMLAGCGGVKFAPASVNEPIPDTFSKRAVYPAGVAGYEIGNLVGNVLIVREGADPVRVDVIWPSGFVPTITPITDPNSYYRSRIQAGAQAQGEYLAFAAKFSADEMADLTLADAAMSSVDFSQAATWPDVRGKIATWVRTHPKSDSGSRRLWVKTVVLTRKVYNSYSKIGADASGQVGEVTGVKTGIYRKSDNEIKSVIIGYEAFDVDLIASDTFNPVPAMSHQERDKVLERARYRGAGNIAPGLLR